MICPAIRSRGGSLIAQGCCFGIAHSLTFWLTRVGYLEIEPTIMAPILILGVVSIGIENFILKKPILWRLGVVSGLGLAHGIALGARCARCPFRRKGIFFPSRAFTSRWNSDSSRWWERPFCS